MRYHGKFTLRIENFMKEIFILSSALVLLTSYSASAEFAVKFNAPQPVEYAEQTRGYEIKHDYPSEHYDIHRHRHNDYWANRKQEQIDHRTQTQSVTNGF